ncbi:MAG TPA: hypothetical protein VHM00_15400 [Caldimonas sp.]|jgi:hypothetical protein|nr:hypothetical protein [Caldimonas sp.]HEX2542456.1 hypothetical protein [Caldimonas sp.]
MLSARSSRSPRELAAPLARALDPARTALVLSLAGAALAVAIGLATSTLVPLDFLEEGGPVETATVYLYVLAAACVLLARLPSLRRVDKAAIGIVLIAFAAREADLHVSLFEFSILKASFYHRHATPGQIVAALAILLPVVLSFLLLLRRHGGLWLAAPSRWRAPVVTVTTFVVLMLATKVFDRMPAVLVELRILDAMPAALRNVLLALEEVLEMALPLLAILAVVQGRLPARGSQDG